MRLIGRYIYWYMKVYIHVVPCNHMKYNILHPAPPISGPSPLPRIPQPPISPHLLSNPSSASPACHRYAPLLLPHSPSRLPLCGVLPDPARHIASAGEIHEATPPPIAKPAVSCPARGCPLPSSVLWILLRQRRCHGRRAVQRLPPPQKRSRLTEAGLKEDEDATSPAASFHLPAERSRPAQHRRRAVLVLDPQQLPSSRYCRTSRSVLCPQLPLPATKINPEKAIPHAVHSGASGLP